MVYWVAGLGPGLPAYRIAGLGRPKPLPDYWVRLNTELATKSVGTNRAEVLVPPFEPEF